ncbi:MAG: helix-turn-helix transcriptional regulator [Clostridia bacterium]|nr:helix-turn-helix transcriptional regulator [Clostridia bacterium]
MLDNTIVNCNKPLLREVIGKNIKSFRKKHKITQEKLAELSGIHRTSITKYETAKATPTLEHLLLIAKVLNESPNSILYAWEIAF